MRRCWRTQPTPQRGPTLRVLVLGADGMLGHQVARSLLAAGHDPVATTRRPPQASSATMPVGVRLLTGIDARRSDTMIAALGAAQPAVVVNCIGIVKQREESKDALESIQINSLFPHQLAALCRVGGARLVHISTDCVFSGSKGDYTEDDMPDPIDLYGRTKLLGEVDAPDALTLRTSIIGLELHRMTSLVEWFLSRQGPVHGWTKARYSGVTTSELARVIVQLIEHAPDLHGLWHVSADPIDKYSLLCGLRDALHRDDRIIPDDQTTIDRTLNSQRFRSATSWAPPAWSTMLEELAEAVRRREVAQRA